MPGSVNGGDNAPLSETMPSGRRATPPSKYPATWCSWLPEATTKRTPCSRMRARSGAKRARS